MYLSWSDVKPLLGSLTELSKNSVTADCLEKDFGKCWADLFINLHKRGHDERAKKPEAAEHGHSGIIQYIRCASVSGMHTNTSVAINLFFSYCVY